MSYARNDAVEALAINTIEGVPARGTFMIKPMLKGEHMSVLEVRLQPGVASEPHAHAHESMLYVVSGRLRNVTGSESVVLGPGDVGCHPRDVLHSVEALEETVFVEIKSPVPNIAQVLKR